MTRSRSPLVESFGPELLAALLKASTGRYVVKLPFNHAVRFRQRLYSLRNAMRIAKHEKYSLVSRVRITIAWDKEAATRKAGDHTVPIDQSEPCEVELMPNDTEFSNALAEAGVQVIAPSLPELGDKKDGEVKGGMDELEALLGDIS